MRRSSGAGVCLPVGERGRFGSSSGQRGPCRTCPGRPYWLTTRLRFHYVTSLARIPCPRLSFSVSDAMSASETNTASPPRPSFVRQRCTNRSFSETFKLCINSEGCSCFSRCRGGAETDWSSDLWLRGGGFDSRSGRGCLTTLGKLFAPLHPCNEAV